jgi:hypothetical protein
MEDIGSKLKDMISSQLSGNSDARSKVLKSLKDVKESNEGERRNAPQDYLKDPNGLKLVFDLAKQKRTNKVTIRKEIKKLLKNPEEINDFLNSILSFVKSKKGNDKEEAKEMTGSGSAGGYSAQLFGHEMKESVCKICGMKNCKCQDKKHGNISRRTETKEATGSASSGQYSGPSIWAKSTNKKDWGPSRNTQIPGGKFVQVKKKCKKFPYCNQGDINALKIFENKGLKRVITNISESYGITENYVRNIIYLEMEKLNKH